MNHENEARKIFNEANAAIMKATDNYTIRTAADLWDRMIDEASFILVEKFIQGKYNPMDFNEIRNELTKFINSVFEPFCNGN